MNKIKMFLAKKFFKEFLPVEDAGGSTGGATGRELASEIVKSISYKENNETSFESPEFDLADIQTAYNTDSYVRQGVDKYVDQIFKEGYQFYGTDTNAVEYLKLRLDYIAEASQTPTSQLLMDIAEDLVKYGNCMLVKARSNDPNAFPQGQTLQGLWGKDPVAGYFSVNPVTFKCQRDDYGVVQKWQQDNDKGKQEFDPQDVVHFFYKREKGNAYGTSFLIPVLDDVQALRQAEENVLKMMYRNIYPFYHVQVGTEDATGTSREVDQMKEAIDGMDVEGGLVTTERVTIKPIASDKVIDAEPYLRYLEERIFSGMGIPGIMWGRGNTANRSTGDNMTSEMADRIRAISKVIETFFNSLIIKELLMEGGYDPVLNPDQAVEFRFNDNDVDVEIKKQVHSIYKYEHNAITEDEMREELGMDPIEDSEREKMFVELITRENLKIESSLAVQENSAKSSETGTKETNNKSKNGGGKPKSKDIFTPEGIGLVKDTIDNMEDIIDNYIKSCYDTKEEISQVNVFNLIDAYKSEMMHIIKTYSTMDINSVNDNIVNLSTKISNQIYNDLVGIDYNNTSLGLILDTIEIRFSTFKDTILSCILKNQSTS